MALVIKDDHNRADLNQKEIPPKIKKKLRELTYRQYLALSVLASKWAKESTYPSADNIKEIIGFKTDRMLSVTLNALEKKGFIKFHGLRCEPMVSLTKDAKNMLPLIVDKLLLSRQYLTYKEIKHHKKEKGRWYKIPTKIDMLLTFTDDSLTHLNNDKEIVNRWYNLLEDYPPSLVWNKLDEYNISSNCVVLDPFVGSGTTLVTSKLRGIDGIGIDVHPVAAFVTEVKTQWEIDVKDFKKEAEAMLTDFFDVSPILDEVRMTTNVLENMPRMELNQWLSPRNQNTVAFMIERIKKIDNEKVRRLLLLSIIEAAQESSNVSFCPGTSFYPFRDKPTFFQAFERKLQMITEDLSIVTRINRRVGKVRLHNKDMKKMSQYIEPFSIDFILTSPPYPNDLEYTRQTRLDLYLLGYVKDMEDVIKIKKKMVKGSTKLIYKESNSAKYVEKFESVQEVATKLEDAFSHKKWGWDYPRMVREYFGDLYLSLAETIKVLKNGSYALFVVGDQTYKEILIPVGKIIVNLAKDLNFSSSKLETFRVRRSTLHRIPLKEEIVILKK